MFKNNIMIMKKKKIIKRERLEPVYNLLGDPADNKFIYFLFSQKIGLKIGDNLQEMSKRIVLDKIKKKNDFEMPSAI